MRQGVHEPLHERQVMLAPDNLQDAKPPFTTVPRVRGSGCVPKSCVPIASTLTNPMEPCVCVMVGGGTRTAAATEIVMGAYASAKKLFTSTRPAF